MKKFLSYKKNLSQLHAQINNNILCNVSHGGKYV